MLTKVACPRHGQLRIGRDRFTGPDGPSAFTGAMRRLRLEIEARDSRSVTHLQLLPSGPDPGCIGRSRGQIRSSVWVGSPTFVTVAPSIGFPESSYRPGPSHLAR